MTDLTTAVCSITATQRRRFFWAAWWTGAPTHAPFRKPDAANGGARTAQAALAEAERIAGRHLVIVDAYWARAWKTVLRGQPAPPPPSKPRPPASAAAVATPRSAWSVLGLEPGANVAAIRRAFHDRALESHPDQGGDAAQFRAVLRAYERLTGKRKARARAARKRREP
ncbi:MAG TPA: J domain-containing protein [Polyangiales bacterium]|nr:J domain-containing protein [Polyangiales bacterium]